MKLNWKETLIQVEFITILIDVRCHSDVYDIMQNIL